MMKPAFLVSLTLLTSTMTVGTFSPIFTKPSLAQAIPAPVLRTLTVTGQGVTSIPSTLAKITLSVQHQGKTAQEAQQEVAKQTTAVLETLKKYPLEQLQTTQIQLEPAYEYTDNQTRLVGYNATNTISFCVKIDQSGPVLDAAIKAGVDRIDNFSFTATDTAITEAQTQALALAGQNARDQGDIVLKSLGLSRQEIVSIQVNGSSPPPPPILYNVQMSKSESMPMTPVIAGEQRVEASVTLVIKY